MPSFFIKSGKKKNNCSTCTKLSSAREDFNEITFRTIVISTIKVPGVAV